MISGKATVCSGPRRAAKSTFPFQRVRKIPDGVARRDGILNFFDDRLRQLQRDGFALIPEAYFSPRYQLRSATRAVGNLCRQGSVGSAVSQGAGAAGAFAAGRA